MGASLFSVAICTHARAEMLGPCLAALAADIARTGTEMETIVVDSGSPEPAATAIRAIAGEYGARHIRLSRSGLSAARNAALAAAQTPYVAYVDDDAAVVPGWSRALEAAIRAAPGAAAIGGPVLPDFAAPLPDWWPAPLLGALSILEHSPPAPAAPVLYGANFTVHRDTVAALGGFPDWLGRRSDTLLSHEETYLLERISETGGRVVFAADCAVRHRIPADRLCPSWLIRRQFWSGASEAVMLTALGRPVIVRTLHLLAKALLLLPLRAWPEASTELIQRRADAAFASGFLHGLRLAA